MTRTQIRAALGVVVAVALVTPASASATRYVTPTGLATNDCQSIAEGCDLKTAIQGNGANVPTAGEEVIVEPGSYSLDSEILAPNLNLNIHGVVGQPRPVITQTDPMGEIKVPSGAISYLDIEGGTTNLINLSGGVMDRVFMRAASSGNFACQCSGGLIRNSVFISTGSTAALGVTSNGGTNALDIRNVTAIATDELAAAIGNSHQSGGSVIFNAYNVIARNTAGGTDVAALGTGATITFHHSNYSTIDEGSGGIVQDAPGDTHQSASPHFTNAGAGDYSEAPGSPTIDAGITDPLNGPLDFAGNARSMGSSTDIGAYEVVVPPPAGPGPSAGPTGQRAKALKKCKKKHSKKKRKKCRKRAKRLPI
jgi:hypothetical protein